MHIEVDKKAHRDKQTDRQTREHAEAYKTRHKGSQGRTQRQIKVKIKIKSFSTRRSGGRRGYKSYHHHI